MGIFDIFKRHQTQIGKDGENYARSDLEMNHQKVKRTGIGSDFETEDKDFLTNKTKRQKWEVKVNNSPLSARQKKTRGLKVIRLREGIFGYDKTVEDNRGNEIRRDYLTGKEYKVRKSRARQSDDLLSGFSGSSMFGGTGGSGRRRRKKNDLLGF